MRTCIPFWAALAIANVWQASSSNYSGPLATVWLVFAIVIFCVEMWRGPQPA